MNNRVLNATGYVLVLAGFGVWTWIIASVVLNETTDGQPGYIIPGFCLMLVGVLCLFYSQNSRRSKP